MPSLWNKHFLYESKKKFGKIRASKYNEKSKFSNFLNLEVRKSIVNIIHIKYFSDLLGIVNGHREEYLFLFLLDTLIYFFKLFLKFIYI